MKSFTVLLLLFTQFALAQDAPVSSFLVGRDAEAKFMAFRTQGIEKETTLTVEIAMPSAEVLNQRARALLEEHRDAVDTGKVFHVTILSERYDNDGLSCGKIQRLFAGQRNQLRLGYVEKLRTQFVEFVINDLNVSDSLDTAALEEPIYSCFRK